MAPQTPSTDRKESIGEVMDHEFYHIEEMTSSSRIDARNCQVCGSPFGDDVYYHSDGNLEGVDSICSDCDSWHVRLVTEDNDV